LFRSLLLRDVPAALTSLAQSGDATATSSSAARTAAGPSKLAALIASSSQRQLRLQVHALLTTVVKCAAGLNAKALRNAVAAAPAPAASGSSSSSSLRDAWTPPSSTLADRVGQFRGTLELINSAAAAAAALGRAVSQAAAGSSSTVPLTAPFVSLIGRCLHLTGTALEGASKEPQLGAAEFSSVSTTLATLLSCLHWVVADTACCRELLSSTGAADAAAVDSLRTSLQQQLAQLQGSGLQGLAVAAMLCDSGLAGQLQSVGGAMCGVVTGVCGNPACSSLSELSEIALVTPGGGKKGCGKCAACASVSYCSRCVQQACSLGLLRLC
jgi:hypothetical protein